MSGRHLRLVTAEDTEVRNRLLSHPACDGMPREVLYPMDNASLELFVATWEQHTERGQAWVRLQQQTQ